MCRQHSDGRAGAKMRQSSTSYHTNFPFLPPEIYSNIAQYVRVRDLPNFRLASKTLARAGRPGLFDTVVLRMNLPSWTALKNIHHDEQLSKLVRTLIVDVTLWRIGTDVRDWHEWTRHCESQADHYTLEDNDPAQAALYKELAQDRHLWEAYLSRLEGERVMIEEISSFGITLPNLQKVQIVRGAVEVEDRHVRRLPSDAKLPITAPLSGWRGDSFSVWNDINKLIPHGCQPSAATKITKWRLGGLTITNFLEHCKGNLTKNSNVTSVKIRDLPISGSSISTEQSYRFRRYVSLWHNLESLDLHFQIPVGNHPTTKRLNVQQCFGRVVPPPNWPFQPLIAPLIWQRLRKLSLAHILSLPEELISLVDRHASTLRDLRLCAIAFCGSRRLNVPAPLTLREIFQRIGEATNLDNLNLSGLFLYRLYRNDIGAGHPRPIRIHDQWDFDTGGLGDHVAAWIMEGCKNSQWEDTLPIFRSCQTSHYRDDRESINASARLLG